MGYILHLVLVPIILINKFYPTDIIKLPVPLYPQPAWNLNHWPSFKYVVGITIAYFIAYQSISAKQLITPVVEKYWVVYCSRASVLQIICSFSSSLQNLFSNTWVSKCSINTCWYWYCNYRLLTTGTDPGGEWGRYNYPPWANFTIFHENCVQIEIFLGVSPDTLSASWANTPTLNFIAIIMLIIRMYIWRTQLET